MLPPDDQLSRFFDHTVLKADTTREVLARFCEEALRWNFASVCVNPVNVAFVAARLAGSEVRTCAVVGFPLGTNRSEVKVLETTLAVADDIAAVVRAAHPDAVVKVIIETSALDDDEKVRACRLAVAAGAGFVKTSTGFGTGGATAHDVDLMARTVGGKAQVKASTGIVDLATFEAVVDAGATRVGTSKGIAIVQEAAKRPA